MKQVKRPSPLIYIIVSFWVFLLSFYIYYVVIFNISLHFLATFWLFVLFFCLFLVDLPFDAI